MTLDREAALDRASGSSLDVLVIGGGITGVGIALDAATRGYSVALVERDDLASGTSSKSSKLIHGGVRYLEQGDVGLVFEAARERERLRRLAPHLVRPMSFVIPVDTRLHAAQLRAGLLVYDGMLGLRNVRRHGRLTVGQVLEAAPGLSSGFSHGGFRYVDCRTDDARLTLAVAQAAARHGAMITNHTEAVGLLRSGDRVVGASVRDRIGGRDLDLTARWVVSATGVWADRVRRLAPERTRSVLSPSKGVHVTLRASDVPIDRAVIVGSGVDDGRAVFLVPWGDQVYVGTTDERFGGSIDAPNLESPETDYLLHAVNRAFGTTLRPADVVGAWAGLRPLLGAGGGGPSKDLSRRHAIFEDPPGLVTITGGKLTTYRQMAQDLVDRLAHEDGNRTRCSTTTVSLGATGTLQAGRDRARAAAEGVGAPPRLADAAYGRHGDDAPRLLVAAAVDGELEPLVPGLPYLTAEVRWAVREEMARTLDDVLQRRMRVSLRDVAAGGPAVARAAAIVASELGWDAARTDHEIAAYLANVSAERGVVPLPQPGDGRPGEATA